MSAPFPESAMARDPQGERVFSGRDQSWRDIPERGVYIALWYDPSMHPRPEQIVVSERVNGELVPLMPKRTVADVAPEFRPFIRPDGSILTGDEFKDRYKRWQEESFKFHGSRIPKGWNSEFQCIPNPRKITALGVDPVDPRRHRTIGYDPNATKGATPSTLHTSSGEPIPRDRMEMLVEAYQSPAHRKALKKQELEEVEAYLESQGGNNGVSPVSAKLNVLTEMLHSGELTQNQYLAKVEALTEGASVDVGHDTAPPKKRRKGRKKFLRPCGREISNSGWLFHKKSCEPCQNAEDAEEA